MTEEIKTINTVTEDDLDPESDSNTMKLVVKLLKQAVNYLQTISAK